MSPWDWKEGGGQRRRHFPWGGVIYVPCYGFPFWKAFFLGDDIERCPFIVQAIVLTPMLGGNIVEVLAGCSAVVVALFF